MTRIFLFFILLVIACEGPTEAPKLYADVHEYTLKDGTRCVIVEPGGHGIAVDCDFNTKHENIKRVEKEDITDYERKYKELRMCPTFESFDRSCRSWMINVELLCEPGPNRDMCVGFTKRSYEQLKAMR